MLNCVLLGPGTSVTHEAIKVMAAANCNICWVAEDSMMFLPQVKLRPAIPEISATK